MHPRRVRHDVPAAPEAGLIVSIHAPAWGATSYQYVAGYVTKFQSTHPRGVRPLVVCSLSSPLGFNPRTRVGCDGSVPSAVCNTSEFQSTHPRGVRPDHPLGVESGEAGFNPRTRVGCDLRRWPRWLPDRRFNPRTRVGCDAQGVLQAAWDLRVSIHAPAWGATCGSKRGPTASAFQSTHPRGVRRGAAR